MYATKVPLLLHVPAMYIGSCSYTSNHVTRNRSVFLSAIVSLSLSTHTRSGIEV